MDKETRISKRLDVLRIAVLARSFLDMLTHAFKFELGAHPYQVDFIPTLRESLHLDKVGRMAPKLILSAPLMIGHKTKPLM